MTDIVASEVLVYKTTDYDKFVIDEANRPIIPKKVTQMADKMKNQNWLQYCPIIVSQDLVVYDGQHRLKAAAMVGGTVYYIIAPDIHISDIASMNRLTTAWTGYDYLNYWVVDGENEHYIKLSQYLKSFPLISLSAALFICSDTHGYGIHRVFREGLWEFGDEDIANEVGEIMELIGGMMNTLVNQSYSRAIKRVVSHPKYDRERMRSQLERTPNALRNVSTQHEAIEILQYIYNYNMKRSRVAFTRV